MAGEQRLDRGGVGLAFAAYLVWGNYPLYFQLVSRSSAFEIVAYRVVCALLFCLLVIVVLGKLPELTRVLKQRRVVGVLAGAGLLISGNWALNVWAVNNGHALDASLGYFMNPLVNAALGVLVLGERIRRLQWVAFAISASAVVVLVVGYGSMPWAALGLATSFAVYGLMKKQIGGGVPPLAGLVVETSAALPIALGFLIWLNVVGAGTVTSGSYALLISLAGPITAAPLLLFAASAPRIPLSTMGIVQYVSPIMQFFIGWLIIGEQMPPARWIGFLLIWAAVIVFVVDALRQSRLEQQG